MGDLTRKTGFLWSPVQRVLNPGIQVCYPSHYSGALKKWKQQNISKLYHTIRLM